MRKKSIAFALLYLKPQQFIDILRATECDNFLIEVTNTDILFHTQLNNALKKTISEIINSHPEIISVFCSFSSQTESELSQSNFDIALDFMLDENVFLLSCKREFYENTLLQIKKYLC